MYTYTGYPAILMLFGRLHPLSVHKKLLDDIELPSVSVFIAARNEETTIGTRLENLSAQDYPKDRFEIVVVSDGSNDGTGEIVAMTADNRPPGSPEIRLIRSPTRQGKPTAPNAGVVAAKGQIIVFADCRQTFDKNAIRHLVANFADPDVGCVSGELLFVKGQGSSIEEEMGAIFQ
ncbi:glycosyltransferase [Thermodesulfobacteriota bacterium]